MIYENLCLLFFGFILWSNKVESRLLSLWNILISSIPMHQPHQRTSLRSGVFCWHFVSFSPFVFVLNVWSIFSLLQRRSNFETQRPQRETEISNRLFFDKFYCHDKYFKWWQNTHTGHLQETILLFFRAMARHETKKDGNNTKRNHSTMFESDQQEKPQLLLHQLSKSKKKLNEQNRTQENNLLGPENIIFVCECCCGCCLFVHFRQVWGEKKAVKERRRQKEEKTTRRRT